MSLTDEEDILGSGIDINCHPPGKIVSHLEALSGGERVKAQMMRILMEAPTILLLDEPCYGLPPPEEAGILSRISAWLDSHPRVAAICVAHRRGHVPVGFTHELSLAGEGDRDDLLQRDVKRWSESSSRRADRLCGE